MPSIVLAGLASNDPVPGNYFQLQFAAGPGSAANAPREILIVANKSSAGSATVDTIVYGPRSSTPLQSMADAATLLGVGSPAYRMYKRILKRNKQTPINVLCPSGASGSPVKATLAITFATNATATGLARVYFPDDDLPYVDTVIATGDTPTTIAANVATSINAAPDWPFTATSSSGVLTLQARVAGKRGNWLRSGVALLTNGTAIGTTVDTAPGTVFTSGAGTESWTTALSTIASTRYYYIVSEDDGGQSSALLSSLVTQVVSQALPVTGIRERVFAGSNDGTTANLLTQAVAINSPRFEYNFLPYSDVPPCELGAILAAAVSFQEIAFSAQTVNWDSWGVTPASQGLWGIPAPRSGTPLTRALITSCLNNGVSPIAVNATGQTYLVSRITSYSQNGSVADYRVRDSQKVTVGDFFCDDAQSLIAQESANTVIGNDVPDNAQQPPPGVFTPRMLRNIIRRVVNTYGDAPGGSYLLKNVAEILSGIITVRETSPATRLSASVPLQICDLDHQNAVLVQQVA